MPLPKPGEKEDKKKFLDRCLSDETMNSEYPDSKQRYAICMTSWRKVHGGKPPEKKESIMTKVREIIDKVLLGEQETSTKSWAQVNKSKLPASCFLWVSDKEKKSTWKLPYREGAGGIDPKTGMYRSDGPINLNAVRAIMSALGGARTGKAMNVPADVRKRAEALAKKYKIGKYKESMFMVKYMIVAEAFVSLRSALDVAVQKEFGKDAYVADFSNREVIVGTYTRAEESPSVGSGEGEYKRVSYKISNGEVTFTDEPKSVRKVISYEQQRLSTDDLFTLIEYEAQVKE